MRSVTLLALFAAGCIGKETPTDDSAACDDPLTVFADSDGDGFGDPGAPSSDCFPPAGAVENADDCDDGDAAVNPDAAEVCDDIDNDCDGLIDDADDSLDASTGQAWYPDDDGDGYGVAEGAVQVCVAGDGYAQNAEDCDDGDPDVHPGAQEVCSGVDDDCDGLIDDADDSVDASNGTLWFPDVDRDTFGDADDVGAWACADPSVDDDRWTTDDSDCDDNDEGVHPGATEVCNGVDDDCDPGSTEEGLVGWVDADGNRTDLSADLAAATSATPYDVNPSTTGTLWVCEGSYYATITAAHDLDVVAPGGADLTIFDGGGGRSVLDVRADGVTVNVQGLTLTDGLGSGLVLGSYPTGGGVLCDAEGATLTLTDVVVSDNEAGVGAGVYSDGCALTLTGGRVSDNVASYYGGGVAVLSGDGVLDGVEVLENEAVRGGGLFVISYSGAGAMEIIDTVVEGNSVTAFGGGAIVENATLTCTGSASVRGGFFGNVAGTSGGGVNLASSTAYLEAVSCDFGTDADGDNNSPQDINTFEDDYEDDVTLSCSTSGCQ